jgi:two-component system osmolarity sensor histidine kinase EnvZ
MLAGVSHDLRTPLTRIKLQLALMKDSADTKAISDDIREMEDMIDGYITFAAGGGEEAPSETSITELLERMINQTRRTLKFDIKLMPVKDEIPDFPLRRNAIQRAFANIISNATRYSTQTCVTIQRRNDEILVTFDDDGAGIPEERRADAVRPFVRLEESRNRRTGGTGLGLSITSDIVLGHGGELSLGDSPLGGLRVVVKLPV